MDATVAKTGTEDNTWGGGGKRPMGAPYGKLMMWFFLTSDALTFSSFLAAYGLSRFNHLNVLLLPVDVFTEIPFFPSFEAPMIYTAFMTFVLIFSSVTMVLAVDAGRHLNKKKVTLYLGLTILGGLVFIGSQAYEWTGFINGEHGAVETKGGRIVQFYTQEGEHVVLEEFAKHIPTEREALTKEKGAWFNSEGYYNNYNLEDVIAGFKADKDLRVRLPEFDENGEKIMLNREKSLALLENQGDQVVEGANLTHNEYGHPLFADLDRKSVV